MSSLQKGLCQTSHTQLALSGVHYVFACNDQCDCQVPLCVEHHGGVLWCGEGQDVSGITTNVLPCSAPFSLFDLAPTQAISNGCSQLNIIQNCDSKWQTMHSRVWVCTSLCYSIEYVENTQKPRSQFLWAVGRIEMSQKSADEAKPRKGLVCPVVQLLEWSELILPDTASWLFSVKWTARTRLADELFLSSWIIYSVLL